MFVEIKSEIRFVAFENLNPIDHISKNEMSEKCIFLPSLSLELCIFALLELCANNTDQISLNQIICLKNVFINQHPWLYQDALLHVCVVCECLCFERVSNCPAWS